MSSSSRPLPNLDQFKNMFAELKRESNEISLGLQDSQPESGKAMERLTQAQSKIDEKLNTLRNNSSPIVSKAITSPSHPPAINTPAAAKIPTPTLGKLK